MAKDTFSLSQISTERPRLLASSKDFEGLRTAPSSAQHLELLTLLQSAADEMLQSDPVRYEREGLRLLSESRKALKRLSTLALLYRLHKDPRYLARATDELETVIAFPDWNPSHYLDTAEMMLGVALGADWLWEDLSESLRERIVDAIVEKGIQPSLNEAADNNWWITTDNNWNPVCHASLVAGALLIADSHPAIAERVIKRAIANVPRAIAATDPDGIYPEGPMYWDYGTTFTAILINLLETATGSDFGLSDHPSFQRSIEFRVMTIAPTGQFYNFYDSGSAAGNSSVVTWFASRFGNPMALYEHQRQMDAFLDRPDLKGDDQRLRLLALQALWFPKHDDGMPPKDESLPKVWFGGGPNPLSIVRSGWDDDAFYFASKGGSASLNHAHQDAGSFIFEDQGVRWAVDLGKQDYHSLESNRLGIWDMRQHSDRWRVFRLGPYSHNLLLIDEQPQRVEGVAKMTVSTEDPGVVTTRFDLSEVYAGQVESYIRSIEIHDLKQIKITEKIMGARAREGFGAMDAATLRWRMVTGAQIEIKGNEAVLTQDGKQLHVRVLTPDRIQLRATPLDPPPYFWDAPNPGMSALDIWTRAELDGSQTITVVMVTEQ
jgi:hypothetical protein